MDVLVVFLTLAAVLAVLGLALLVRARSAAVAAPSYPRRYKTGEEEEDEDKNAPFWSAIDVLPGPSLPQGADTHLPLIAKHGLAKFVRDAHAEHGPLVTFRMGSLPEQVMVSVRDPVLLQATLRMGSRPKELFRFIFDMLGEDNLQVYNADRAKIARRQLSAPFAHRYLMRVYEDSLLAHAKSLMNDVAAKADQPVALQAESVRFALRAALSVIAGCTTSGVNMEAFQEAYDAALNDTYDAQFGLSESKKKKLDEALAFLRDVIDSIIEAKRAYLIKHGPSPSKEEVDLVEVLCTSNDPETGWPYDQAKIRMFVMTYLVAAYHTSAVSTAWAMFLLTQHPDVQKRVQQEVDDVLQGREPTFSDLEKLTYVNQVLKESMRVFTPAPFGARLVEQAMDLGGHHLPAGCTVMYPHDAIHKDERLWPEPSRFDPDRFAPNQTIAPLTFVPFGLGPRICPGERMAWVEMRLLMALFMQRFTVELAVPVEKVIPEERFVLWARDDIVVRFTPRTTTK